MRPINSRLYRGFYQINRPDGEHFFVNIYGTAHRPSGRRMVAWRAGEVLFDTGDHIDLDNARNAMANWLASYEPRPEPVTSIAVPPG